MRMGIHGAGKHVQTRRIDHFFRRERQIAPNSGDFSVFYRQIRAKFPSASNNSPIFYHQIHNFLLNRSLFHKSKRLKSTVKEFFPRITLRSAGFAFAIMFPRRRQ
jgi:hypothetical protein